MSEYGVHSFVLPLFMLSENSLPGHTGQHRGCLDRGYSFKIDYVFFIIPAEHNGYRTVLCGEIWNSYFALIYIRSDTKYPLQLILRQVLLSNAMSQQDMAFVDTNIGLTVKYATIIVSTVPILMVYPFIQKYFVKGVMIGSIKG